jgi:hypothetical protein
MIQDCVFGYGSLVNASTHDFLAPNPARLSGWRRYWCQIEATDHAFLSICRSEGDIIDGLLAPVEPQQWPGLDAREAGYDRLSSLAAIYTDDHAACESACTVYAVPPITSPTRPCTAPILRSYLDVVLQGYLTVFGLDGAKRFMASTDWNCAVLDDRAAPLYPRHQHISAAENSAITALLHRFQLTLL